MVLYHDCFNFYVVLNVSANFNPEDAPTSVSIWVRLPHIPLIHQDDSTLQAIGDIPRNYIDRVEPVKNQYSCNIICVEVNWEKCFLEAIHLNLERWIQIKELENENLTLKYKQLPRVWPINNCRKNQSKSTIQNIYGEQ